jgi:MurNAc alpha-1-phosphate uridylyltransferase
MSTCVPHTAMLLAAGLGTRMRPLTDHCPKPLVPINNKPIIEWVMAPLAQAGVRRLVVNVHYLADQIEVFFRNHSGFEVIISDERGAVLETGGALAKARPFLGSEPVFVLNTDAFWFPSSAVPLRALAEAFDPETEDERLLLADPLRSLGFSGSGDFFMGEDGSLTRRGRQDRAPWVFSGVRIINPNLYDERPAERFSATKIWDEIIPKGRLKGLALDSFWLHVGDPEALKHAEMWLSCHGA